MANMMRRLAVAVSLFFTVAIGVNASTSDAQSDQPSQKVTKKASVKKKKSRHSSKKASSAKSDTGAKPRVLGFQSHQSDGQPTSSAASVSSNDAVVPVLAP